MHAERTLAGLGTFDVVHVGGSCRAVPHALLALLRPGGRLLVAVGLPADIQVLTCMDKGADGSITITQVSLHRHLSVWLYTALLVCTAQSRNSVAGCRQYAGPLLQTQSVPTLLCVGKCQGHVSQ